MLRKITAFMLSICLIIGLTGCSLLTGKKDKKEIIDDFKVAVVTQPLSENKVQYNIVEELAKEYEEENKIDKDKDGKAKVKQTIKHVVLPENFTSNIDNAINQIVKLADDKEIQAIVVSTDQAGLLPALQKVKEKRSEIITISAPMGDDKNQLSQYVDVNLGINIEERGKLLAEHSKEMGAKAFIHYASKDDLKDANIAKRLEKIKEACKNIGLQFVQVDTPNMNTEEDKNKVKQFLNEDIEKQVKKYGKDINVFGVNEYMDEVILTKALELKYIVAEQSNPSPTQTYPEVMGLKISKKDAQNYDKINDMISEKAKAAGMSNRLGGYPMPMDAFIPSLAIYLASEMVKGDLTQEDVSEPDYLEAFTELKFGIGAEFAPLTDVLYNYQLVILNQLIY
ncbi:putative lipoprotein [Clostridioides difficile CD160]|nr:putative lipoprotein [Clostridioides difficile CD160]